MARKFPRLSSLRVRGGGANLALGGVLLATLIGYVGWPAATAAFTLSCVPNPSPHDDAARYSVTVGSLSGITGVSSNILELDPYYTGQNGTGTNSSIMLVNFSPTQLGTTRLGEIPDPRRHNSTASLHRVLPWLKLELVSVLAWPASPNQHRIHNLITKISPLISM